MWRGSRVLHWRTCAPGCRAVFTTAILLTLMSLCAFAPCAAGGAPLCDCRAAAQSPTEVVLQCHLDWPAIAAAAENGGVVPSLGFVAIPRGARASLDAGTPVRMSPPMRLRGIDVVGLAVDLGACTLAAQDVEFRVRFEGGPGLFGEERLRTRLWEPVLERWILNHASLPAVSPAALPDREEGCEFVILCPDDAASTAWADSLRAWRTLQGISTQVFTTAEIGSTWQEIRDFLVNAYTTWTVPPAAFLLLGDYPGSGDGRLAGVPAPLYQGYAVSDNLYADIDGDGLPDMFHGRITAHTSAELAFMVGKLLAHERTPSLDPGFYAHPVVASGWDPDGRTVMEMETIYGFQANVLGKEPVREYVATSPGTIWPDPQWVATFGPGGLGYIPATPEYLHDWGGSAARINADINAGAFMVIHRGAGMETAWGDPLYTVGDVAGLANARYPFVFSLDALTGRFNSAGTCLTEALHRSAHGALGMISATEIGYALPTCRLMLHLFNSIWPDFLSGGGGGEPELRPGCALVMAKYALAIDVWPVSPQQKLLTYHLFHHHGDPLLVMNSEVPQPLLVEHAGCCPIGASAFSVQTEVGALIGLTVNGELIGVGSGTGAPVAIPIIPPTQAGTLRITVTRQNHLRYDERVPILDPSGVTQQPASRSDALHLALVGANPHLSPACFQFAIPPSLAGARASLCILDATGRSVRTLVDGRQDGGTHESRWDGADDAGAPSGAGVYFARLTCGGQTVTRRFARLQ